MAKRTALALILTAFLALPAQGQSDTEREPSTLTVSGRGEVRVAPDEATVRLGGSRQRVTAQEAQEDVNQVAQEILATVIQLGVEAEQIQTSELRLSPLAMIISSPARRYLSLTAITIWPPTSFTWCWRVCLMRLRA